MTERIDIRALIEAGEIDRVVTIVDMLFDTRDRAERLADAHLLQIRELKLAEGGVSRPRSAAAKAAATDAAYADWIEANNKARRELTEGMKALEGSL